MTCPASDDDDLVLLMELLDPFYARSMNITGLPVTIEQPDSPETTHPAPSSRPSSAAPASRASWWAWSSATPTSETRRRPSAES
mmetsp:Transcript_27719/g.56083  ORF Transcript_27719/g.56083 Transcript_27719/m.56083 type:complete len:84 (+) Transcript_27719:754-1005(+)